MKIGILGSGKVGGTLGKRWAQGGHEVLFSSRHPDSGEMKQLVQQAGGRARAASVAEAAGDGEVILLAAPWKAAQQVLEAAGDLAGKVLIDATNPFLPHLAGMEVGTTDSAGERVAKWARGARVVKALNTVGFDVMANPRFGQQRAFMPYCGDDMDAKSVTRDLVTELGFEAMDIGPLTKARLLEPFSLLWLTLTTVQEHGRGIAFQLLTRS